MKEISERLVYTMWLPECQGAPCSKQAWYIKINWVSSKKNTQPFSKTGQMVRLNGWVFVYEISGCETESRCSADCLICV